MSVNYFIFQILQDAGHRRRIYTEEMEKVVATVWGAESIQFLAALAIFHQDDMKKRMNSFYSSTRRGVN